MTIILTITQTPLNINKTELQNQIDKIAKQVMKTTLNNTPKYHNTNPYFQSCKNIFKELHYK